jgi:hypothetical protein
MPSGVEMTEGKTAARVVSAVQAALSATIGSLGSDARHALVTRLARIVEAEVKAERDQCIQICRGRAELWSGTFAATSPIDSAREEARARANEATCLADLLEARSSESEPANA